MKQSKPISKQSNCIPKAQARLLGKKARASMTDAEYALKSEAISKKVSELFHETSNQTIHMYDSIRKNREVFTKEIMQNLTKNGHQVYVQPQSSVFSTKFFNYIIIPSLMVDYKGARVGYGGGFYDRFLAQQPENTIKVGLVFESQLSITPLCSEEFDIALDIIATESRTLHA